MSKNLRAFRCGANILGYNIDSNNYVMTCAWAMMIDYDKIAMLIGAQSITGQNLKKDMKVGVSSLALGQESIAKIIGSTHSDEVDKLKDDFAKITDEGIEYGPVLGLNRISIKRS